jgi:hypothetical protein
MLCAAIALAAVAYLIGGRKTHQQAHADIPLQKPAPTYLTPSSTIPTGKDHPTDQVPSASIVQVQEGFSSKLDLPSPDHYTLEIREEKHGDMTGLMMKVKDTGLQAISKVRITVYSIRGFDNNHQQFRQEVALSGIVIDQPDRIGASAIGRQKWLMAKQLSKDCLFVGDNTSRELKWPELDTSVVHKWLLNIGVNANRQRRIRQEK